MNPYSSRAFAAILLVTLSAAIVGGCGEGTVTFGGGDDDDNDKVKINVTGNLNSVSPVTTRDIVVFVYNIDDNTDRCPCPPDPSNSTSGTNMLA